MSEELPGVIRESGTWGRLRDTPHLAAAICGLRSNAAALADTISRDLSEFTDHSVRHMDALFGVADRVLQIDEVERLSAGEAFLLASTFYLHDIGMAFGATETGLTRIRSSEPFEQFLARLREGCTDEEKWRGMATLAERAAFSYAVRILHASVAPQLATEPVPGTDIHLLEPKAIREAWGPTAGKIAASHHWNLDRLHAEFGGQGVVPLPEGEGDLGYVACLLRLIDYAHISRDRAPSLVRAFQQTMPPESMLHWLAQEHIDGPLRDGRDLVYRSAAPISNVDAWWLYYSMLSGLDAEIRSVHRYLDERVASQGRLSLASVRGATTPEDCATFIETDGFIPLEVNIRAGSIERLVTLLGGESLYGPNKMVPLRELIQNSQDALSLKRALADGEMERVAAQAPIRIVLSDGDRPCLEVVDHGVGMSRKIVQDYLVTIASDYWGSELFHSDFPDAGNRGFRPAGKFGIGFVSVFMIAGSIEVTSNRSGGERLQLALRGIGRRGEIRLQEPASGSGTSVRLRLKDGVTKELRDLASSARALAPMIENPIEADEMGEITRIEPGWWKDVAPEDLISHIISPRPHTHFSEQMQWGRYEYFHRKLYGRRLRDARDLKNPWPLEWPEWQSDGRRILAFPGLSETVLCVRGIALQSLDTPGFVGVVNVDSVRPDASRSRALDFDRAGFLKDARSALRAAIVRNLDVMGEGRFITDRQGFLRWCVTAYGEEILRDSSIRWLSLVMPPGDVETLSCAEFLKRLISCSRLRIAFGTGPWTAMRKWAAVGRGPGDLEIVVDVSVDYRPDLPEQESHGTLKELWPESLRNSTVELVLNMIGEGWQVAQDSIVGLPAWERDGSKVFGDLDRDAASQASQ